VEISPGAFGFQGLFTRLECADRYGIACSMAAGASELPGVSCSYAMYAVWYCPILGGETLGEDKVLPHWQDERLVAGKSERPWLLGVDCRVDRQGLNCLEEVAHSRGAGRGWSDRSGSCFVRCTRLFSLRAEKPVWQVTRLVFISTARLVDSAAAGPYFMVGEAPRIF